KRTQQYTSSTVDVEVSKLMINEVYILYLHIKSNRPLCHHSPIYCAAINIE
ncbi:hypothetical protein ACI65C_003038, partial [Semiaphis heraclei]